MEFWIGLVLGLIIGWSIELLIDWLYWRRRQQILEAKYTSVENDFRAARQKYQADIASLEAELVTSQNEVKKWEAALVDAKQRCQVETTQLQSQITALQSQLSSEGRHQEQTAALFTQITQLQAQITELQLQITRTYPKTLLRVIKAHAR